MRLFKIVLLILLAGLLIVLIPAGAKTAAEEQENAAVEGEPVPEGENPSDHFYAFLPGELYLKISNHPETALFQTPLAAVFICRRLFLRYASFLS